ncbi:MAG: 3-deoxy-D-manno-octulosonic acid transferase, partial [Bacteroidales bacterium]|nr:3-deoxy-D-manno-octulosonic acid transferase [Bacteroidales bacterium]
MTFFYNIAIQLYLLLIRLASLFNKKAALWLSGRKNLFTDLSNRIDTKAKYIWIHCASLGEFEQGRPVIEQIRKELPGYKIALSFFSPSGYEVRKNYNGVDLVTYLPIDTPGNARKFIEILNPQLAVFVKYEFWFNYLKALHNKDVAVLIISAIFRKEQHFFKTYGGWFRNQLRNIHRIFVQNQTSAGLLHSIGIENVTISGDTRFDRVADIALQPKKFPVVEKFAEGSKVLLAGSSWPADERFLPSLLKQQELKLIIAPHEIHEEHLKSIETMFPEGQIIRFSKATDHNIGSAEVLLIDGIGFLSSLYQYCDIAHIGGGFGKGIHNILEAVTFGKPVVFGPNYRKFNEAVELIQNGGAFTIKDEKEFLTITGKL